MSRARPEAAPISARWRSCTPYACTVRSPCRLSTSSWPRSATAIRSCAYRGAASGRYQRRAITYQGTATAPASPNRQSIPAMVARLSPPSRTAEIIVGSTSVTALVIAPTSAPTRDNRSPRPAFSSTVAGRRSARPTVSSRRSASIRPPSRAASGVVSPVSAPPATAAITITTAIGTMASAPSPARTRSTRTPSAYAGTTPAAAASSPKTRVRVTSSLRDRSSAHNHARVSRAVATGSMSVISALLSDRRRASRRARRANPRRPPRRRRARRPGR